MAGIPNSLLKRIYKVVDSMFDRFLDRFVGRHREGPAHYGQYADTLGGILTASSMDFGVKPDSNTIETVKDISLAYVQSERARTKAQIAVAVNAAWQEAKDNKKIDWKAKARQLTMQVMKDTESRMSLIIDTEVQRARSLGILTATQKISEALKIDDPMVYFVIARGTSGKPQSDVCSECIRLHLMPDRITPRVYRLAELNGGYHKKGDPNPSILGLHPHCRCTMCPIYKGYGFNAQGQLGFVSLNFSEFKKQRS